MWIYILFRVWHLFLEIAFLWVFIDMFYIVPITTIIMEKLRFVISSTIFSESSDFSTRYFGVGGRTLFCGPFLLPFPPKANAI